MSDIITPIAGRLGQLVSENPDSETGPVLEFFIELDCRPVEVEDEGEETPLVRANNIVVPVKSWKGLAGQTFEFPWSPKPGSIEATVLMFSERNPTDLIKIEFGEIDGGKIKASFTAEADFEIEGGRDELGQVEFGVSDYPLTVLPLKVSTALARRCQNEPEEIAAALDGVVDLLDYQEIAKVPGGFEFPV